MLAYNRILLYCGVFAACSTCTAAFFLNWGSSEPTTVQRWPPHQLPVATFYQHAPYQHQQQAASYSASSEGDAQSVEIPAIPVQLPLQAQLSPAGNIHNVQLVPCLCPVSPDAEYAKYQDVFVQKQTK